jgi:hypothetical protein
MDGVAVLHPLDAALIELVSADSDDDEERAVAAITAVALAWIKLDERAQITKLRYFHSDKPLGAALRSALAVAASKHDLGECGANYAALKGRPW